MVADGGLYALLGPYAIAAAAKECRIQSSKLVDPTISRHIALAMSRHCELTLACRAVMSETQEIASAGAAALP
jgi:LysR family transcriptional regulator, nitrogen assimilation regulatory protein